MPVRIVGAENEIPGKDYLNYLYSKSDVWGSRMFKVTKEFKLSITDFKRRSCLSNERTMPWATVCRQIKAGSATLFLHLIKCVTQRNQTHWSVLTLHQKTKAQHLINSHFEAQMTVHVCLSGLQASNSAVILFCLRGSQAPGPVPTCNLAGPLEWGRMRNSQHSTGSEDWKNQSKSRRQHH